MQSNIINIDNRNLIKISGVSKVISMADNQTVLEINDSSLVITGSMFEVKKLDVEHGEIEMTGAFDAMKFVGKKEKQNFIKRIFK